MTNSDLRSSHTFVIRDSTFGNLQFMDVRTYRARSMQDALRLIREDLGPDAAVLHTREVNAGVLGGIFGGRQLEVTASTEVNVPSRLPAELQSSRPATTAVAEIEAEQDVATTY